MSNVYRSPPKFSGDASPQLTPATESHLNDSLTLQAQASAPSDPIAGQSALWMNANGDIRIKINVGGTIKTATLADFSSL